MTDAIPSEMLVERTAEIVSAYAGNNTIAAADLVSLVGSVHSALKDAVAASHTPEPEALIPAVPIKKSVTPDFIICLEDGKKLKTLKRHLRTFYGLTPEAYRAKWGLDADYPMIAPNYAANRSRLAKAMGLGKRRKGKAKASKKST